MSRLVHIAALMLGGWGLLYATAAGQLFSVRELPGELVQLRNGRSYRGFIESEDAAWINLIQIVRPGGKPMYLVIRPFDRASVAKVVRLEPERRAELWRQIERFRNRTRIESVRMEAIRLETVAGDRREYCHYGGKWFSLDSAVDEQTTRRIIVRVEQIFTAYRQLLAPRTEPFRPLRVVVLGSVQQYEAYLKRLGIEIRSQACFIQEDNLVVAGSELARFTAQLSENKAHHDRLLDELDVQQKEMAGQLAELGRQLKAQGVPRRQIGRLVSKRKIEVQKTFDETRKKIARCNRENARMFDQVTRQMFVRLYHEAFHAYLESYVYPRKSHLVPLWLNEGLAMVCEAGQLESDTLRIDAPHAEALKRLKTDLAGQQPLSLQQVLAAGQQEFLGGNHAPRYYVYAWGLVHYLTFEKSLLDAPAMDRYVRMASEHDSAVQRFEQLVGMPLAEFEHRWHEHISKL